MAPDRLLALSEGMADRRRAAAGSPVPRPQPRATSEADFLARAGVRDMLREAALKLLEARPEDPLSFLADYFHRLGVEAAGGAKPGDAGPQRVAHALWYLRLAHHSQSDNTEEMTLLQHKVVNKESYDRPAQIKAISPGQTASHPIALISGGIAFQLNGLLCGEEHQPFIFSLSDWNIAIAAGIVCLVLESCFWTLDLLSEDREM